MSNPKFKSFFLFLLAICAALSSPLPPPGTIVAAVLPPSSSIWSIMFSGSAAEGEFRRVSLRVKTLAMRTDVVDWCGRGDRWTKGRLIAGKKGEDCFA